MREDEKKAYELNLVGPTPKYNYLIEINPTDKDDEMKHPLLYGVSGIKEAKVFESFFNDKNPQGINALIDFVNEYEETGPFAKTRKLIDKLSGTNIIEISNNIAKGIDENLFNQKTLSELEKILIKFEKLSELVKTNDIDKSVLKPKEIGS